MVKRKDTEGVAIRSNLRKWMKGDRSVAIQGDRPCEQRYAEHRVRYF